MIIEACTLVLGGIGAIVGAVISTTEKGKKIDENLTNAFELFESKVSKYLPTENIKDMIEGGN